MTTAQKANIIGSGPNGLAAAIALAQAGWKVTVHEGNSRVGGALGSEALTLPGFVHDVGSAIHPLGAASPFFRSLPLHRFGLDWVQPPAALAHPLEEGLVLMYRSLEETAAGLGTDEGAYLRLMRPLVANWKGLLDDTLRPLIHFPAHPVTLARFGLRGLPPASVLARTVFRTPQAQALLGGLAAHSGLPLSSPGTSAFGLMLAVSGHAVGWPFPRGGAQAFADVLAGLLRELGGEIVLNSPISSLSELPEAQAVILDTSLPGFLRLAEGSLPAGYAARLNAFRPGVGAFKVDYALSGAVPWRDPRTAQAGTVHLGGALSELEAAELAPHRRQVSPRPYVLLAQQSLFDATRAPEGKHTLWAYVHVPNGYAGDALPELEAQIERFAPGFSRTVLARTVSTPATLQGWNPNLVGGDVGGGANTLWQLLARPQPTATPYRTPLPGVYLCSASTPPGGGVHGMGGYWAARAAMSDAANGIRLKSI
ncbi:NAD(P)/FAD-dependent oxidoreductase [Deinococcus radiomollis]|uniref:phytoene desaturase family protein n=1 Tax=Deinococcus radiomollis TaxID=468916 RepID=UPI003892A545